MRLRNIQGAAESIGKSGYVLQNPEGHKGHWNQVFDSGHPIHIEVGMGKGRFLMDMAKAHPDIDYIGIEMYDSVLLRAVQKAEALEDSPENFRFIRMDARELSSVFEKGEVEQIYLNFSDPWPKDRHAKRRLTSRQFLKRYTEIILPGRKVEFKTDNKNLFEFSLQELKESGWVLEGCTFDLHKDEVMNKGNIMTEYEEKFSSCGNAIYKFIAYYQYTHER
ncbi:tRNA (guanosine(46)-N7)-methyltransferase TrmB [Novisyntrophococcus fermenticellae]|uniref:tRNA (guanosine(46)-N7)-methyltransferase TrmB n=1 Tax=Novisyntrophococcus fermenticellae TaxID=2068655 RepID=UPI001E5905B7|nr:tRNA (guanosine(46)-N7)-methyltransferase TrmB [Novisyntrophococcus fermenticellae]